MEFRDWAIHILSADRLEDKLFCPEVLTDFSPGPALFWKEPTRPPGMGFEKHTRRDKLPRVNEMNNADKRAVCLHRFAGHELLAVEIMAYALLAFPEAPPHFRKDISTLSLTFEMANLDFAPFYGAVFAENGDTLSSQLMEGIFEDEIAHVSFGCRWLKKFKDPSALNWKTWKESLPPLLLPSRARGPQFFADHRRLAGVDEEWIKYLEESV